MASQSRVKFLSNLLQISHQWRFDVAAQQADSRFCGFSQPSLGLSMIYSLSHCSGKVSLPLFFFFLSSCRRHSRLSSAGFTSKILFLFCFLVLPGIFHFLRPAGLIDVSPPLINYNSRALPQCDGCWQLFVCLQFFFPPLFRSYARHSQ